MDKGYKLRDVRVEKGYSQTDIANVLNTTQQQYSKYEVGAQELPARHIITLCKFYKVSSDRLLGLDNNTDESESTNSQTVSYNPWIY